MKKTFTLILLLLPILLLLTHTVHADEVNLLRNPGFEDSVSEHYFWNERVWDNDKGACRIELSQEHPRTGRNCLKMECTKPNDARLIQSIPVKPSTIYKISGWIKTQNVQDNAKGANLSVWMLGVGSRDIRGDSEWTQVEFYGKTGDEQTSLEFTIGLGGHGSLNTGTVYFDDISITRVDEIAPGTSISNLYDTAPARNAEAEATDKYFWPLITLALMVLAIGIGMAVLFMRKEERIADTAALRRLDQKDFILMFVMTLLYLAIALFQLGTTRVPQTYWTPTQSGESFTLRFDSPQEVGRLAVYSGIGDVSFVIQYPDSSGKYLPIATFEQKTESALRWQWVDIGKKVKELKFTLGRAGGTISEIVVLKKESETPLTGFAVDSDELIPKDSNSVKNLFDEQNTGDYQYNFMNSSYFDEIYHPRTAFENLHGMNPYENTHPPLGKLLIAAGIAVFGMNPLGWRIMGTLFGAAMIPVMYLFGRRLFKGRIFAFISAFLMMFDLMHFAQTRIGTIDSYPTLFVMLAYYFMADSFINKPYRQGFKRSLVPLLFAGVFWGLGCASKWTAVYAGGGLALLYLVSRVMEYLDFKRTLQITPPEEIPPVWTRSFVKKSIVYTSLCCIVFFVLIPILIYVASYIPMMTLPEGEHGIGVVWENQKSMYDYHSKLTADHPFQSPAYSWPLISRPLLEYRGVSLPANQASILYVLGNPAIYWFGIAAILAAIPIGIFKRDRRVFLLLTAFAFQYLPWFAVSRCIFIYHFFTAVPFLMLCVVYFLQWILEDTPVLAGQISTKQGIRNTVPKLAKVFVLVYLILVFAMFVLFYPAVSGLPVDESYTHWVRWLNVS